MVDDEADSRSRFGAAVIVLVAVVIFSWVPRVRWGLGLDETFSAWQAAGGSAVARTKLANPGQSIFFGYIEALFYFPGTPFMEIALRVPALVGAAVSAFFVWRLAESFVGRGAGFTALVPFVCNIYVIRFAAEARPYTLATAACLTSLWSLHEGLQRTRRRHLLLFCVSSALVVHLHLMYVGFFFVPIMLVARFKSIGRPIDWRALAAALAFTVLLVAPLIPFLRDFSRRNAGLSFMPVPGWRRFAEVLAPFTVLAALPGLVVLFARFGRHRAGADRRSGLPPLIMLGWLVLPPLMLFVASRVTGKTVLNERYLLHTVAAQSLVVAGLYRRFPAPLARVALLVCFLPIPIFLGSSAWPRADGFASYRAPFRAARAVDPSGAAPLFLQAGHPLSNVVDWRHGPDQGSFLYSPLTTYPVPNRVLPLPYALDDAAISYVRTMADGPLHDAALILFIGETQREMTGWFDAFFEVRGYAGTFVVRQGTCLLVLRRGRAAH
jgi:hypothetical protein